MFDDYFINGDSNSTAREFDGLKELLSGQDSQDRKVTTAVDLFAGATNITANHQAFLERMEVWLAKLNGQPDALIVNRRMKEIMRNIAAGHYNCSGHKDEFGRTIPEFDGVPIIDLGNKQGTSAPIVEITSGPKTDIYAVRFGLDAVHSISPREDDRRDNGVFIRTCMPDPSDVNKVVEIAMVTALALKNVRAAGVLKGIGI